MKGSWVVVGALVANACCLLGASTGVLGTATGVLGTSTGALGTATGALGTATGALGIAIGAKPGCLSWGIWVLAWKRVWNGAVDAGALDTVLGTGTGVLGTETGAWGTGTGALGTGVGALGTAARILGTGEVLEGGALGSTVGSRGMLSMILGLCGLLALRPVGITSLLGAAVLLTCTLSSGTCLKISWGSTGTLLKTSWGPAATGTLLELSWGSTGAGLPDFFKICTRGRSLVLESSLSDGSVAAAKSVAGTTLGRSKKVLVVGVANTLVRVKSSSS